MIKAHREALMLLHRLGRRQGFAAVFAAIVDRSREATGFEAAAWRDLEDLLAIDLEGKRRSA
jgi:hypothetical protein